MNTRTSVVLLPAYLLALAAFMAGPVAAHAQPVTYTVDPHRSSLTLSATFGGSYGWGQFTIRGQGVGTMVTCFEGTIAATNLPGGGLGFGGGSSIRARRSANSPSTDPNAPSFHPTGTEPNPPWSGTDNYGGVSLLYDQHAIYIAYRDLVLDIPGGGASVAGEPASTMTLGLVAGHVDWSQASVLNVGVTLPVGTWPTSRGSNQHPGKVTVSADGSVLTIPVVLVTRSYDLGSGIVSFDEIWTGTIVAVAGTPSAEPPRTHLALAPAGPAGLQFIAGAGTAGHYNGITTAPWVESSWVGGPASYSFTITNPPSRDANGFRAHVWLVANPAAYSTEEFSGAANPNVVRLGIESDGQGGAIANLAYRANGAGNPWASSGPGFLGRLAGVPFAGHWTIRVNDNTEFQLIAPNGAQAVGSMTAGDTSFFAEKVRFYLGVSPNGAHNIGQSMTVGDITHTTTRNGQVETLAANFTTGAPLHKNWTILAADPASIIMMPPTSAFRAQWHYVCTSAPGADSLEFGRLEFGDWESLFWGPADSKGALLANGTRIHFVTDVNTGGEGGFFRVVTPSSP